MAATTDPPIKSLPLPAHLGAVPFELVQRVAVAVLDDLALPEPVRRQALVAAAYAVPWWHGALLAVLKRRVAVYRLRLLRAADALVYETDHPFPPNGFVIRHDGRFHLVAYDRRASRMSPVFAFAAMHHTDCIPTGALVPVHADRVVSVTVMGGLHQDQDDYRCFPRCRAFHYEGSKSHQMLLRLGPRCVVTLPVIPSPVPAVALAGLALVDLSIECGHGPLPLDAFHSPLPSLRRLRLSAVEIDNSHLAAVAALRTLWPRLERLDLANVSVTADLAHAETPLQLGTMHTLCIDASTFPAITDVAAFLGHVHTLRLTRVLRGSMRALEVVLASLLPTVRCLDLSRNRLHAVPLYAFRALPELHTLDLSHNPLGLLVIKTLVEAPCVESLEVLGLANTNMDSGVIDAFAAAHWARLRDLDLRGNDDTIDEEVGRLLLTNSKHMPVLKRVRVGPIPT